MKEYSESVVTGGVTVIKVKEHKTGKFGTAKLTLDAKLANRLHRYVHTLRPLEVGDGVDPGTLFVLPGSKAITKWSNLEAFLKSKLGIDIPTSTWARKIGTTCAARTLDVTATSIIATQMSHQAGVAKKHYTLTAGAADAARAFKIMEELRTGEAGSSSEQRYKTWGSEEANRLQEVLKSYIIKDVAVPLSRCEAILSQFPGRTPKNLQDKIKTFRRQKRKNFLHI